MHFVLFHELRREMCLCVHVPVCVTNQPRILFLGSMYQKIYEVLTFADKAWIKFLILILYYSTPVFSCHVYHVHVCLAGFARILLSSSFY